MSDLHNYESEWLRTAHEIIPEILYNNTFPIDRVVRDLMMRDCTVWEQQRQTYIGNTQSVSPPVAPQPVAPQPVPQAPPVQLPQLFSWVPHHYQYEPLDILMHAVGMDIGAEFGGLADFLGTHVSIRPTANELESNTSVEIATTEADCAVCQDKIIVGDQTRKLNFCNHTFHRRCVDPWLASHITCPTCRHDMRVPATS